MNLRLCKSFWALVTTLIFSWNLATALVHAGSPFASLIPFGKSPAPSNGSYELTKEQGPWLILAASFFDGENAEKQADSLVRELRTKHKLAAYVHRQAYDFTAPESNRLNARGELARVKYANVDKYDAIAVLVGDFRSVDDPTLEKTLEKIKYLKPECLDIQKHQDSKQAFAGIRQIYRSISSNPAKNQRGPMGSAFATRNPLLPDEYFTAKGVDEFVAKLNRGVEYSLLDNPGRFTVRVATFRGATSINQREIAELERSSKFTDKLEVAADKAHRLTVALRKQKVEAYEFHDRTESIVTIGSFESEGSPAVDKNGQPLRDGSIEINPQMLQIIQRYKAVQTQLPGRQLVGMQPRTLGGVAFDVQPIPIQVPRRSLAADYTRRKLF